MKEKVFVSADEKIKCRAITKNNIKKGVIKKEPCMVCGKIESEAHHEDYTNPFDILWLCDKHHHAHHTEYFKKMNPPPLEESPRIKKIDENESVRIVASFNIDIKYLEFINKDAIDDGRGRSYIINQILKKHYTQNPQPDKHFNADQSVCIW